MTNGRREPTQEEIAQARAETRGYALKNLKASGLLDLSTAYLAQKKESGFGEADNDAVDRFLYAPAVSSGTNAYNLESGDQFDLVRNSILGSRQDGERYSGQVSERGLIKSAAKTVQDSISVVKVSDVLELIGSSAPINEKYKDKYLVELMGGDDESKQIAQTLIGGYLTYITTKGVSKALEQRAGSLRSGLEAIVKPEEKKKDGKRN